MIRELDDWIDAIEDLLEDGGEEEAHELALEALAEHPDSAELFAYRGDAEWALGHVREANESYEEAIRIAPQAAELLAAIARIRFSLCDFFGARRFAKESLKYETRAEALDVMSRLAERSGRLGEADRLAAQANLVDDEMFSKPFRMSEDAFEAAVNESVISLPEDFQAAIRDGNVALIIDPVPAEELLIEEDPPFDPAILGLYRGIPLPERTNGDPVEPDTIHIFHHNVERVAEDFDELIREIAITVYHELGHFFGLNEDELTDLDLD